jgi:hypothetical protein
MSCKVNDRMASFFCLKRKILGMFLITASVFLWGCVNKKPDISCYNISDEDAIELIYAAYDHKMPRQKDAPVWKGRHVPSMEILTITENQVPEDMASLYYGKDVHFGENGEIVLTGTVYADCTVGWSEPSQK